MQDNVETNTDKDSKAVYNAALAMLSRREYSEHELKSKLAQKFSSLPNLIDCVIDGLIELNYLCDQRYAESYIRARSQKGFGSIRIRQELREKGVMSTLIENAFSESSIDWYEQARAVRQKKYGEEPKDLKEKAKQQGFLRYRGFDSEVIQHSFEGTLDYFDVD